MLFKKDVSVRPSGDLTSTTQSIGKSQGSSQGYTLISGGPESKSFLSKLKNLGYTLSAPFRAILRNKIDNTVGHQKATIAMKNINSEVTTAGPEHPISPGFSRSGHHRSIENRIFG